MNRLVLATVALCLAGCGSKTVLVQGTGSAQSKPDYVLISASVQSMGATPASATGEATQRMRAILNGLQAMKLRDDQIIVGGFAVEPNCGYDRDNRKYTCDGYTVSNEVGVRLSDLSQTGAVLGKLGELGADRIDSPMFGVSDEPKLRVEARDFAVEDARQQAMQYAKAAGWRLGKVLNIENREP